MYTEKYYFFRTYSKNAIISFLFLLVISLLVFPNRLQVLWIFTGLLAVISFFYFTQVLSKRWNSIPEKRFRRKIFYSGLTIRIIYIIIIYYFFQTQTGDPFEFGAADSRGYHGEGVWIAEMLHGGSLEFYFNKYLKGFSDSGWPLILGFIYFIFPEGILIARLVNALLGAWMVLLIHRLAQRNFGEPVARMAAIMAMLLPTFIYYSGVHLKEVTMVFLLVVFAERADLLIRSWKFKPDVLISVGLLGISLFFFRTVLAVAAWFGLFSAVVFTRTRIIGLGRKAMLGFWFILAAFVIFSGAILQEVSRYYEEATDNQGARMGSYAMGESANTLANLGSAAIFAPLIIVAPFPTMVNIEYQQTFMMMNGANFTRNVYAFFVLIALWELIRRKLLTQHVLILVILFTYLFILSVSGFAFSERFHMPALPFLLILAAYGVVNIRRSQVRLYIPYLIFVAILVLGWNWFKLAGRGII